MAPVPVEQRGQVRMPAEAFTRDTGKLGRGNADRLHARID
jgi:hypothetical protein